MIRFIDVHRERFGVEPICRVLAIAPSSYYAARRRPRSARVARHARLATALAELHRANFGVYGVRKLHHALARAGIAVGRDQVARLMRAAGLRGTTRGRRPRTTRPTRRQPLPDDLVARAFRAAAPNRLWVADLTYVRLRAGFCYVAFVVDVFSRRIVGWRVGTRLGSQLALDALEQALWTRAGQALAGLVHHSDRGVQYLALRYTQRLAAVGAVSSVGAVGDSYDNALAESVHALYKAELIERGGPWHSAAQVELATAGWVTWWNEQRLHSACGNLPPAEFEQTYWAQHPAPHEAA
jgi:putative transposase